MAFFYTVSFVTISYIVIAGKYEYHRNGWIGLMRRNLLSAMYLAGSAFERCIPVSIIRGISNITNYILFTRNPCVQLLYGFLVIGGSSIYTFKVIPFFDEINIFSIVEYVFIAINVTLFWICSTKDPGAITAAHHAEYMKDYEPDGVYYSTAQDCYTCKLVKPARSKHCSICDVCISRFDHHCSWVNNCIGKKNYKSFLGFIISTAILCLYTAFVVTVVFAYIVISDGLMTMKYVDLDGRHYTASIRILTQYLLVHYPLLAILLLTVSLFGLAMSGFSLFHFYLVLTNQTTNELYKRFFPAKHRTRLSRQPRGHGSRNKVAKRRTGTDQHDPAQVTQKIIETPRQISTPYNKGVWKNIREVLIQM